jgi:hypothetical protein
VSGAINRMIARARAPLSPVRPLLPSRYEPDTPIPGIFDGFPRGEDPHSPRETVDTTPQPPTPAPPARPVPRAPARAFRLPYREDAPSAPDRDGAEHPHAAEAGAAPVRGPDPSGVAGESRGVHVRAAARLAADGDGAGANDAAREGTADGPGAGDAAARTLDGGLVNARPASAKPTPAAPGRPGDGLPASSPHPHREPRASRTAVRPPAFPAGDGIPADTIAWSGTTEVTISIGQVEVRAAQAPQPVRKAAPRPRVTLDEYLRRHPGDGR